jgi:hypothetical protein
MKRYTPVATYIGCGEYAGGTEVDEEGEYVLHDDHLNAIDAIKGEPHADRCYQSKRLKEQLKESISENLEQARLLGMSASREAALLAELAAARRERDEFRSALLAIFAVAEQYDTPDWNVVSDCAWLATAAIGAARKETP